jgi:hypothetical protein
MAFIKFAGLVARLKILNEKIPVFLDRNVCNSLLRNLFELPFHQDFWFGRGDPV